MTDAMPESFRDQVDMLITERMLAHYACQHVYLYLGCYSEKHTHIHIV